MDQGLGTGGKPGGTVQLRELVLEHEAELAYDFRERFGLSIDAIGDTVTWREALLLTTVLLRDPSSWVQAKKAGWKFPVSREWIVGAHTYDLLARVNSKQKPKPYPNPFPDKDRTRMGRTSKSRDEVRIILDRMNPKEAPNGN